MHLAYDERMSSYESMCASFLLLYLDPTQIEANLDNLVPSGGTYCYGGIGFVLKGYFVDK